MKKSILILSALSVISASHAQDRTIVKDSVESDIPTMSVKLKSNNSDIINSNGILTFAVDDIESVDFGYIYFDKEV